MRFERTRQSHWDKRYLVTVSTHLTRQQYDIVKAVCQARGTKPYRLMRDCLLEYAKQGGNAMDWENVPALNELPEEYRPPKHLEQPRYFYKLG